MDQTLCVFVFGEEVRLEKFREIPAWENGEENPPTALRQLGQKPFTGLLVAPRIMSKCFISEDRPTPHTHTCRLGRGLERTLIQ